MSAHPGRSTLTSSVRTGGLLQPRLFAAGQDWDAIRVEAGPGLRALRFLESADAGVGPVLHDRGSRRLYFLTPPGSAGAWEREGTRALGRGSWVVLVPSGWGGSVRWVSGPFDGPAFTDPAELATALSVTGPSSLAGEAGR
ncbi:hypothetical protein ACFVZE_06460 [Streptomyces anulatus]|uniref:hypothetical protein n=1 Tax=Streptomyces TaxID=1883 RepID=UPI000F86BE24|nr:hypothetical protein [Streptomyces sp. NP10]